MGKLGRINEKIIYTNLHLNTVQYSYALLLFYYCFVSEYGFVINHL